MALRCAPSLARAKAAVTSQWPSSRVGVEGEHAMEFQATLNAALHVARPNQSETYSNDIDEQAPSLSALHILGAP
eukprot:3293883-Amphidinium_carterae.2